MPEYGINSDRLKFGQFLIDHKKIGMQTLAQALMIQEKEKLSKSYRRLGVILWKVFNIFENRIELFKYLKEFENYKSDIEQQYRRLQYYAKDK